MNGRTCPFCCSSAIDEDPSRADVVCMNCGSVLEESAIVSEVQFQERAGGHDVIGQYISHDRQQNGLVGVPGLNKTESREVTYQRGKKLIQEVASQLRINQHCIDTAFNFYKMCVSRNFTRGRPRAYVVASCLYMTCRLENTSHLLLDFSDVTQVNVYELGRTLSLMTRLLKIHLPTTDPCLYVLRFAIMLEFGDKQKDVVTLATRIVQRMKRDWLATGRRPTGICGAALLLASRAHGFNRNIADIVRVVHISDTVVRKRLDEFAITPSGNLTLNDFSNVDLEHNEDPPAFQEARRKAREEKRRLEEQQAEAASKDVEHVRKEINEAIKQKIKRGPFGRMICSSVGEEEVPEMDEEAGNILRSELVDDIYGASSDLEYEDDDGPSPRIYGPTLHSLGIRRSPTALTNESINEEIICDDNDFGDIDDEEIDTYILSSQEATLKSSIWMNRNGSILEEIERKRKERLDEEELKRKDPSRKRKAVIKKKETPENAKDHQDAMMQVIKEKKLSNKINYEVLAELEDGKLEILDDTPRHLHNVSRVRKEEVTPSASQPPPSDEPSPVKSHASRKKKYSSMSEQVAKAAEIRVQKAKAAIEATQITPEGLPAKKSKGGKKPKNTEDKNDTPTTSKATTPSAKAVQKENPKRSRSSASKATKAQEDKEASASSTAPPSTESEGATLPSEETSVVQRGNLRRLARAPRAAAAKNAKVQEISKESTSSIPAETEEPMQKERPRRSSRTPSVSPAKSVQLEKSNKESTPTKEVTQLEEPLQRGKPRRLARAPRAAAAKAIKPHDNLNKS